MADDFTVEVSQAKTFQLNVNLSNTTYESTVGSPSASYFTLGAAVDAGKTRILVTGITTETGSVTLLPNTILSSSSMGLPVDMANYPLITGSNTIIKDINIIGSITINNPDNYFQNVFIGDGTGAGGHSINVISGANRTLLVGCKTDTRITDSGTETTIVANIIY